VVTRSEKSTAERQEWRFSFSKTPESGRLHETTQHLWITSRHGEISRFAFDPKRFGGVQLSAE
jgi:hypothetical protein